MRLNMNLRAGVNLDQVQKILINRKGENKMKKILILIFMVVTLALVGDEVFVVNSISRTLSKIDTETGLVDNTFAQLGLSPNLIDISGNYAYVVNSGDNAIQKIDVDTGTTISNIYIEDSANPWYAKVKGEFLYVTGNITNKIYKIDLTTEEIVAQTTVHTAPQGIDFAHGKVYVTSTGGWADNYAGSCVTVLTEDNLEILSSIPTSLNPQTIHFHNDKLYVMCTGDWSEVLGQVYVIDPSTDTVTAMLEIGGNIGKAAFVNNRGYITDGMNTGIYVIDTDSDTILNDSTNPLTPGGSVIATNGNQIAYVNSVWGSNGVLWVTDTNLENGVSYEVAVAPTDVMFNTLPVPNSDNSVQPAQLGVNIYPNPTNQVVNFSLTGSSRSQSRVYIYNLKGQLIDSFSTSDSEFRWNADRNDKYANGIYFYKINNGNKSTRGKFIILK